VNEQRHKDEMSAALRGDFDRLRERGVAVTLAPSSGPSPEASEAGAPDAAANEPLEARSGWLARFLGR